MPAPLNASLPPGFLLAYNYTVRVTAQDPTDGTELTGVVISNVSLSADPQGSSGSAAIVPPNPLLVPG